MSEDLDEKQYSDIEIRQSVDSINSGIHPDLNFFAVGQMYTSQNRFKQRAAQKYILEELNTDSSDLKNYENLIIGGLEEKDQYSLQLTIEALGVVDPLLLRELMKTNHKELNEIMQDPGTSQLNVNAYDCDYLERITNKTLSKNTS